MRKFLSFILTFILHSNFSAMLTKETQSSLKEKLNILINPDTITISGLSSGGYMAGQMHMSYSSLIKGIAIFSAGPYYCARGDFNRTFRDCMFNPDGLDLDYNKNLTQVFSDMGYIDDISNIKNSKVYIFIGMLDTVVVPFVSKKLEEFYLSYRANVKTEIIEDSAHGFPTNKQENNNCKYYGTPFINYCKFNGALAALSFVSGRNLTEENNLLESPKKYIDSNLIEIDQAKYFDFQAVSLNEKAYIYIPESCKNKNKKCDLHITFHGCRQTFEHIEKAYMEKTGILDFAENFDFIILFPQAQISREYPFNPNGCWDYWGYNDASKEEKLDVKLYGTKRGKQTSAVFKMIQDLVDSKEANDYLNKIEA